MPINHEDSPVADTAGVSRRRSLFIWTLFAVLAGVIFLVYGFASLGAGRGEFVLPLDDVYIHFQYARQLANGQPYIYNPGLPPSSGATSFLYPYVLAVGYLLGFQGLNLGLWALIIGWLALVGSMYAVYRLASIYDAPTWLSVLTAAVFALTGAVSWHFMSGMETGLMVLFTLLTLLMVIQRRLKATVVAASLLSLIRPEGSIMAVLAMGVVFLQLWRDTRAEGRSTSLPLQLSSLSQLLLVVIPVLAAFVQPLVNLLLTGSAVASGTQAKSLLSMIPPYQDVIIGRIFDNFTRFWSELARGDSGSAIFGQQVLIPFAFIALYISRKKNRKLLIFVLVAMWWLFGALAISTLDTAFWHFKRYQMPLIVLVYPLSAWGLAYVWRRWRLTYYATPLFVVLVAIAALLSNVVAFLLYFNNSSLVYLQPLQMARWLKQNTSEDAVIAVHDVGMMRYIGERMTMDMVGLTTPGAADAWRNGPGAVAEFLESVDPRPDYVAAYTTARGLNYLADTGIYGERLLGITVEFDERFNVALGGHFQGIYRTDWSGKELAYRPLQPSVLQYIDLDCCDGVNGTGVDVADLVSEAAHNYHWHNDERLLGFPTEVYEMNYVDCALASCRVLDGGRRINGEEVFEARFSVDSSSLRSVVLVTRLHPQNRGTFDVYVNGEYLATRWIPALPGRWLEVPTLIPRERFTNPMQIRIVPDVPGGHYMPYHHFFYDFAGGEGGYPDNPALTYQDGAIVLADYTLEYAPGASETTLTLDWYTDGTAQGDYIVFVHLYDDIDQPPVAQTDMRPGQGTLPPGNWLSGEFRDTILVDVSALPPGRYRVAIGMFDPITLERLIPNDGDQEDRFFLEDVIIE